MITWTSSLETGHAVVDYDHKRLVEQLNQLSEALQRGEGQDRIAQMIEFLQRYAREHFAREELYMERVGCPAFRENCRAHSQFLTQVEDWINRLKATDAHAPLAIEIHREACAWFKAHVGGVDCKLRGCPAS